MAAKICLAKYLCQGTSRNFSMKMSKKAELEALQIEALVRSMLVRPLPDTAYEQLARYVRLLTRWNARINLTAVRDPRMLVELHVAECLRCAQLIPGTVSSVLDFGSGAGLPGIPIQLVRPDLVVTLAESQNKKAAFLREAARELGLPHTSVYAGRVEDLPDSRTFDLVAMRAVDRMDLALEAAEQRIGAKGFCMVLTSESRIDSVKCALPNLQWKIESMPRTEQRVLLLGSKNGE
jgi:16S rRNA (guanine527-N7)-methyltransferase